MARGEQASDDLTVNLSWPGATAVVPEGLSGPHPRPDRNAPAPADAAPPKSSARPRQPQPAQGESTNDTMLSILDHLNTLSRLVTGTSKASSADIDALGARVERAVADLDGLQVRVLRSLAGFDTLRLRLQKEMAERRSLSDDEVERIADAVTQRLLKHVRVETEGGQR